MAESIQRKPKGKEEEEEENSHALQTIWENSKRQGRTIYSFGKAVSLQDSVESEALSMVSQV